ncbi:MAG: hypothetical protein KIT25_24900 [Enhydrobacter sp.]|nr:MAG: hypothetical protein KIT25_24900 [Enhydrobacter sp.]
MTKAIQDRRTEQEPAITDRMLGYIEAAMHGFEARGVKWVAKTLTDRGRGSQESRYGADFAGVLSISLPGYKVNKGFLAQAKMIEPSERLPPGEFGRLQRQCEGMLSSSPDSFVFLYSRSGITIVPALAVLSTISRNPHDLYSRSLSRFYEEHFECFIGDRRLQAPTPEALETLRADYQARKLLYLAAHESR